MTRTAPPPPPPFRPAAPVTVAKLAAPPPDGALLTVAAVAALLAVRPGTVYDMVERGEVPHLRLGRLVRFRRDELEEWLDGMRAAPGRKPATPSAPGPAAAGTPTGGVPPYDWAASAPVRAGGAGLPDGPRGEPRRSTRRPSSSLTGRGRARRAVPEEERG